jgi:hypothetical protein
VIVASRRHAALRSATHRAALQLNATISLSIFIAALCVSRQRLALQRTALRRPATQRKTFQ